MHSEECCPGLQPRLQSRLRARTPSPHIAPAFRLKHSSRRTQARDMLPCWHRQRPRMHSSPTRGSCTHLLLSALVAVLPQVRKQPGSAIGQRRAALCVLDLVERVGVQALGKASPACPCRQQLQPEQAVRWGAIHHKVKADPPAMPRHARGARRIEIGGSDATLPAQPQRLEELSGAQQLQQICGRAWAGTTRKLARAQRPGEWWAPRCQLLYQAVESHASSPRSVDSHLLHGAL